LRADKKDGQGIAREVSTRSHLGTHHPLNPLAGDLHRALLLRILKKPVTLKGIGKQEDRLDDPRTFLTIVAMQAVVNEHLSNHRITPYLQK
jgi:hypothetical protein